nr:13613_t:CDS:2 [Entrophospora candida]
MADLLPNFLAAYYQVASFLCFIILISTIYQIKQISAFLSRSKWPEIPDLPHQREKFGRLEDVSNEQTRNSGTFIVPDTSAKHFTPTVWIHKASNYVIDVNLIGEISVFEIVLFLLYISLNLLFLYLPLDGTGAVIDIYDRSAYIALANAAFIFPLATRNSIFLTLFGFPFERLIRFHRWVGRTIFILITFHASYQFQTSYTVTNSFNATLMDDKTYLWGNVLTFIIVGITLYGADRLIRFIIGFKAKNIVSIEAIQSGVTKVVFEYNSYYSAGQYMFINIPNLNSPLSWFTWHPISFSSSESVQDVGDTHKASFHMKCLGGFTKQLYAGAQEGNEYGKSKLKLRVDGPYGKVSIDFIRYRTVILIGSGIGVTPMMSILKDLVDRQVSSMPITTQAIYFYWIIPDIAKALPSNKYLLDLKIFLTRSTTTPSSIFFQGRPNFDVIFSDVKTYHGSGDIAVGVCGPGPMRTQVRNAAVAQSDETCLFKVHYETFEL